MADVTPKNGPNPSDSPSTSPENSKVFGYDVASQARKTASAPKVNPNSPLSAG